MLFAGTTFEYLPNTSATAAAAECLENIRSSSSTRMQCTCCFTSAAMGIHPLDEREAEHFKRKISYLHNYSNYFVFSSRFIDETKRQINAEQRPTHVHVHWCDSMRSSVQRWNGKERWKIERGDRQSAERWRVCVCDRSRKMEWKQQKITTTTSPMSEWRAPPVGSRTNVCVCCFLFRI